MVVAALASTALGAAGCGGSNVASAVRPEAPTAAQVLDKTSETCGAVSGAEPLVVDLAPEQRGDLEIAMKSGVAVVAHDCKSLRLLRDCHIVGDYAFMGMTTKQEMIRLESSDEIKANLPLSGAVLVAKLSGELDTGSTLDIALVMVGKRRTTWAKASRTDLVGQCEGATHYVRGAMVGAFAMETGAKAQVATVAEVFGSGASGGSNSSKSVRNQDGRLDACSSANPDSDAPPGQCGVPIRLELVPIDAQASSGAGAETVGACPEGMVHVAGKCTSKTTTAPHLCKKGDLQDCTAQCDKGHAGSCYQLGLLYRGGLGVPRDDARALGLFDKACTGGSLMGCVSQGLQYQYGYGTAKDFNKSLALFKRACDEGEEYGCLNLGVVIERGEGAPKDDARAAQLYKHACNGGVATACVDVGRLTQRGAGGLTADDALAFHLFKRACDGRNGAGCAELGRCYEAGRGVTADLARAMDLYQHACDSKEEFADQACALLGKIYVEGRPGVPQDKDKGIGLLRPACSSDDSFKRMACDAIRAAGGAP
jgi:TPR repeat protein